MACVDVCAQIEPLLPPLKAEVRERVTAKDASMQEYAVRWIEAIRKALPRPFNNRLLTVFAPTDTGDKALVCRFVRPQPPPDTELLPNDERRLLRFVSLIPFLDDAQLGVSLDVWNTTSSFLDLCAGDAEEHALMLCNLFLVCSAQMHASCSHAHVPHTRMCMLACLLYE